MSKRQTNPAPPLSAAFLDFFRQESAGGILLLIFAAIAMGLANSPLLSAYEHLLHIHITLPLGLDLSLLHWLNDGLMAIFFLVVGMEIKREFLFGELKSLSRTLLPIAAALGGMVVPALFYTALNWGSPSLSGWAIPMSTDIAFSLGVLAFAAKGVPKSIAVFLTALAIVDDLGGIVVIALFYSSDISWTALGAGLIVLALLFLAGRRGMHAPIVYVIAGLIAWYAFYRAGIHPTVAGVMVGFCIPGGTAETEKEFPLARWEHALSPWSSFLIMPLFALGNAGIPLGAESFASLSSPIGIGIITGLFLGKPLGIFGAVFLLIKTGLVNMPEGVEFRHFLGAGILAGIGFTMSIFLASLSFTAPADLIGAKAAIVTASVLSGILGVVVFKMKN